MNVGRGTDLSGLLYCQRRFPNCLWFVVPLLVGCGGTGPSNEYQEPPPPDVQYVTPVRKTVTLYIEENGETEAVQRANVRARVKGFLEEMFFTPGAEVKKGDILYVIEKQEYAAAVASAKAAVNAAEASVEVAKAQVGVAQVEVSRAEQDFQRTQALFDRQASNQQELDNATANRDAAIASEKMATATVDSLEAELQKARANLDQAQLDLDYTEVKAPIDGHITKTDVKIGNLVESGTVLATVVSRSPIYANFNISDRQALSLQKARLEREALEGGEAVFDYRSIPVFLHREIDTGFPFKGHVDYISEEGVDQSTGTLAIRSIFENKSGEIFTGLFVRVKVPVTEKENALLVPQLTVMRDRRGSFLLVIDDEDVVQRQPVNVGETFEGLVEIVSELDDNARILIDGTQRGRPGVKVSAKEWKGTVVPTPDDGSVDDVGDSDATENSDDTGGSDKAENSDE
ncbi:efflux RND transporter periplasmic adaptor subunit [Thalassoglobus sp. JC818]|uniref:efflux RND transporter periplasmic adaptor subunit n=1 Tax=Thalassoglobus sp. JC818 TaxID=3232136 RepID=UPI003458F2A9